MRYGYIRNHKKTVKNGQARTRERKSAQKPEAKPRKSQPSLKVLLLNLFTPTSSTYGVGETEICTSPELMYPGVIKEGAGPELNCTGVEGDTGLGDERSMTEVSEKEQMKKLVG
ncbi:hypothetical protein Tco_0741895 [Tanacetum coccineum]